eukprot:1508478-Rhodomonas_salina.1
MAPDSAYCGTKQRVGWYRTAPSSWVGRGATWEERRASAWRCCARCCICCSNACACSASTTCARSVLLDVGHVTPPYASSVPRTVAPYASAVPRMRCHVTPPYARSVPHTAGCLCCSNASSHAVRLLSAADAVSRDPPKQHPTE